MLISCHGTDKNIDCAKWKTGKFYYRGYIIERNDSIQTESHINSRAVITKKIYWISDCEYELTYLSGRRADTLPDGRVMVFERIEKKQKIKIIETAKKFYVFETVTKTRGSLRDTVRLHEIGGFKPVGEVFSEN